MPNHEWTSENLSAYVTGGLSAEERREVEQHLAGCIDCAQTLAESRRLEQTMDDLFANTRPDARMEERAVAKLRKSRIRRGSVLRFVAAAAAVLVVGLVGTAVQAIAFGDMAARAPMSQNNLTQTKSMRGGESVSLIDDSDSIASNADGYRITLGDPLTLETNYKSSLPDVSVAGKAGMDKAGAMGPRVQFAPVHVESNMKWTAPQDEVTRTEKGKLISGIITHHSSRTKELDLKTTRQTNEHVLILGLQPEKVRWGAMPGPGGTKVNDVTATPAGMKIGQPEEGANKPPTLGYFSFGLGKSDPAKPPLPVGGGGAPDGGKPLPPKTGEFVPAALPAAPPKQEPPAAETSTKIIRTGEMEFEVDSFDKAVKKINELIDLRNTKAKGGLVAFASKEDSKKLENGKKRGFLVVRIAPELLDRFIEDLRTELSKFGDLKNQHVSSADVTLQYTDTESTLKAARAVEASLLKIIETKKGDIKDLVAAEATLGEWRTKIEKLEGQMRVLRNQISLSTLTINLTERDIGTPASLVITERVQMRIEVDDVKKALDSASDALRGLKGRILKSELKQHKAGQFAAILHAEVPPAQRDAFEKELGKLGIISENEATRKTQAEGGTGKPGDLAPKVSDVVFEVAIVNVVNIQPRHSVTLDVATADVPKAYRKLKEEIAKVAKAQIRVDQLNEQDKLRITADLQFNVPADKKEQFDKVIADLGHVLKKTSVQAPITETATEQKFGYALNLLGPSSIAPRETVTLKVEVKDVDKRLEELKEAVRAGNGRFADANVSRQENGQVNATVTIDVPLAVMNLIVLKVKESGNLLAQQSARNANVPDNELATARIDLTLQGVASGKQPREKVSLRIKTDDVDKKVADMKSIVAAGKGKIIDEKSGGLASGHTSAQVVFEVPLSAYEGLVQQFKSMGDVIGYETARNPQIPDNDLASAQITVTVLGIGPIVPNDEGIGAFVRKSLSWSIWIFSWCILAIVAGLSAILPVGIVIYVVFKLFRWMWPSKVAGQEG
jgi:hypothetical protein